MFGFLKTKKNLSDNAGQENISSDKIVATAKATAIGRSALVLIINGKLSLGKFDNVVYTEFDYTHDSTFTVALYSDID